MHIDIVPNRRSNPGVPLRESYREGGKVRNRTLADLSSLPASQIEAIRAVPRGEDLRPAAGFEIISSRPHGHVQAVDLAMRRLNITALLGAVYPTPTLARLDVAARAIVDRPAQG